MKKILLVMAMLLPVFFTSYYLIGNKSDSKDESTQKGRQLPAKQTRPLPATCSLKFPFPIMKKQGE